MSACYFLGHRDAPETLLPALRNAITYHIQVESVDTFIVGNYGAFDRMAQRTLANTRQDFPQLTLLLALAYHPGTKQLPLPKGFDNFYYPESQDRVPRRAAIVQLNRTLICESSHLITYVRYISGGAYAALEFAQAREQRGLLKITRL
jgi:hypothetical protein